MDPNATLASLRDCMTALKALPVAGDEEAELDLLRDVAERAEALDQWITRGGFLPDDWRPEAPEDLLDVEKASVEINFDDGTSARWGAVSANLAEKIEVLIGAPDTLRT